MHMRGTRLMAAWVVLMAAPAVAEEGVWQVTSGPSAVDVNDENGWLLGPVLRIEQYPAGVIGFDGALRLSLTNTGFYSASALSVDLGGVVPLVRGPIMLAALFGGSAIAGGNGDGTPIIAGGPYAGLRVGGKLGVDWLGWSVSGSGRLWLYSGKIFKGAHGEAGLGIRF